MKAMGELNIRRLHTRYHLPGGDVGLRARLDRVRHSMLKEGLEAVLDRLDAGPEEQICLRRVLAPVRLMVTDSDASMGLDWSIALAKAIRSALKDENSGEVVRYPTRLRALTDFALGLACGDHRHLWAWRLTGLWQGGSTITDDEAAGQLVETLRREGSAVMPVLCTLAFLGMLGALDSRLQTENWIVLARASVAAAGGDPRLIEIETHDSPAASPLAERAMRAAHASILRPLAQGTAAADTHRQRAVGALVLLAHEPAAFQASPPAPAQLLAETVRSLWMNPGHAGDGETCRQADSRRRDGSMGETRPHRGSAASGPRPGPLRRAVESRAFPETAVRDVHDEGAEGSDLDASAVDPRRRGRTGWGGLLFLLWLVDECEIPRLAAERLPGRSLRSVLHRLALSLLPLHTGDPAALAFAGLAPDAPPPAEAEPPTTPEEDAEIGTLAEAIRGALVRRLSASGEAVPMRQVCARRAEVVADPGWIEVHLFLDEVSTQLRHCGLDLNPEYIPWLGLVRRFIYE